MPYSTRRDGAARLRFGDGLRVVIALLRRAAASEVGRHGLLVFGGVLAANVFSYLFYMLIGRRAGILVYGEVTSLISAVLVLGAPANVLQLIAARVSADLHASGDTVGLRRLAAAIARWTATAGVVSVAAVWLFQDPIARFFNLDTSLPAVWAAVGLPLYWLAYAQRGVLQGVHRFGDLSASLALEAVTKVVLGVWLVGTFGASGALAGFAVGLGVGALYNFVRFRMAFGSGGTSLPYDRSTLVRVVRGVGLGQLTLTVLTFYDVQLVKHAFDPRSAGLYAAAALVGRVILAATAFIPTIILPKAAARVHAGRSPLPLLFAGVGLAATCIAVALAAGVAAPRLVVTAVAGGAFADAGYIVPTYAFAFGALSLATVVASYNFALHRYDFVAPMCAVAIAEMLTLALWHPSLAAVVGVLAVGHACVFAATLYRVTSAAPRFTADPAVDVLAAVEPIG
jgi:O-antigen/teichoic acid export membrane protein